MSDRVTYETWFDNTKAARLRFIDAVLEHKAVFDASTCFHHSPLDNGGSISCLVQVEPTRANDFSVDAKVDLKYRSPTRFDHGTIRGIYATPEAELEARKAARRENRARENAAVQIAGEE